MGGGGEVDVGDQTLETVLDTMNLCRQSSLGGSDSVFRTKSQKSQTKNHTKEDHRVNIIATNLA